MNGRAYGKNIWNPARVALCVCGWAQRFPNLRAANVGAERHVADGCEGCDHAIYIETQNLDNKESRQ